MKVVAGIIQKDNKLLMFYSQKHNKWEFPGGKVDENETDDQALKREWKEELNCDIIIEKWFDYHFSEMDGWEVNYYMVTPLNPFTLTEHTEYQYFTPEEAMNLDTWIGDWLMIGDFVK
jgi:8-oxo-dGTP pyrophosphatase MutT (NUDIX family)